MTGALVALLASQACAPGAGGTAGPAPAGEAGAAGAVAVDEEGASYVRVVRPFEVLDAVGDPYEHPFLGGFDVPRPQLVDIDGDGDLDLFVQERTGELIFLENVGSRNAPDFVWRTDRWLDLDVGEWSRFHDLDGDGDLDLLAEEVFSYIRYFRNVGTPTAPRFELVADSVRTPSGEPVFSDRQNIPNIADIDCDGMPDLFLGRTDGTVVRYEMRGIGPDGAPRFELITERFEDIEIVAQIGGQVAGPPDRDDGQDRSPDADDRSDAAPTRHGANSMAIADWDGDGDLDFLWGDFFEPSVLLIENTGGCPDFDLRGEPTPVGTAPGDSLLTSGYNVPVPVDWDGDGALDLVVGVLGGAFNPNSTAASNLQLWLRTDEGLRRETGRLLDGIDVGSESIPGFGDLDGDGDLDMLVGNRISPVPGGASEVFLFENTGSPTAPAMRLADTLALGDNYHYAPVPVDLDGDGALELVVGTWNDDVLVYRREEASLTAGWVRADSALVVLTRGSNATPALGDLDGDGILDLVVGESSGDVNLYLGTGDVRPDGLPVFDLVTDDLLDAGRRSHPVLVDWDGDGDLDLLVGREAPGLLLFINDGSGSFTEAGEVLPELPPYGAPAFVDLDGDGDLDVVSGGLSGGLVYLENRGG